MFKRILTFLGLLSPAEPLTKFMPVPPSLPTLRRGSHGEAVKNLQRRLRDQGFFDANVGGNFGDLTHAAVVAFQQTHVSAHGTPLVADGIVGLDTWWAIYNHSGKPQQTVQGQLVEEKPTETLIPHGISGDRRKVLEVALGQLKLGIKEVPNGSNTGGHVTKFHEWFGMKPDAWCAMAFCWIVNTALGSLPWKRKLARVSMLWAACKKMGMAYDTGSYRPIPGDAVVWVHSDGTGHIGTLLCVNGEAMIVLEGNSGNAFKAVLRRVGAKDHVGYLNFYGDAQNRPPFRTGLTTNGTTGGSTR